MICMKKKKKRKGERERKKSGSKNKVQRKSSEKVHARTNIFYGLSREESHLDYEV